MHVRVSDCSQLSHVQISVRQNIDSKYYGSIDNGLK